MVYFWKSYKIFKGNVKTFEEKNFYVNIQHIL
jgi:hypothetical protein